MWPCGTCHGYGTICTQARYYCLDCDGTCPCETTCPTCHGEGTTRDIDQAEA